MIKKGSGVNIKNLFWGMTVLVLFFIFAFHFTVIKNNKLESFFSEKEKQLEIADYLYFREEKNKIDENIKKIAEKIDYERLANDENYREENLKEWDEFKKNEKDILNIWLIYGNSGNLRLGENKVKIDFTDEKKVVWQKPRVENSSKKILVTIQKSILNKDGIVKGNLFYEIDLTKKIVELLSINFGYEHETFFVSNEGKAIIKTNKGFVIQDFVEPLFLKTIKSNNKSYFIDKNGETYVFFLSDNNYGIVTKIPKFIIKKQFENDILLVVLVSLVLFLMLYALLWIKENEKNTQLVGILKAIQNNSDIEFLCSSDFKKNKNFFVLNEAKKLQNKIINLENELLRDDETGLYNKIFLENYLPKADIVREKILIIKYLNLTDISKNYDNNIVELVLKRGALTLNAFKESNEYTIRLDKVTLALVLKNGDMKRRAQYIIDEILNYEWRLNNIVLAIDPSLLSIEEYIAEDSN